jgi:hypothetical protein
LLDCADAGRRPGVRDLADLVGYALRSRVGLAEDRGVTRLLSCAAPAGVALAASVSSLAFLLAELRHGRPPSWDRYVFGPFATTGVIVYLVIALTMVALLAGRGAAARSLALLALVLVPVLLLAYHPGAPARPDRATLYVLVTCLVPAAFTPSRLVRPTRKARVTILSVAVVIVTAGVTAHASTAAGPLGYQGALHSMAYYQGPDGLVGAWAPAVPLLAVAVLLVAALGAYVYRRAEIWGAGCLFLVV